MLKFEEDFFFGGAAQTSGDVPETFWVVRRRGGRSVDKKERKKKKGIGHLHICAAGATAESERQKKRKTARRKRGGSIQTPQRR